MRKSLITHEKVIEIKKIRFPQKKLGVIKYILKSFHLSWKSSKKTFVKIRRNLCSNVNVDIFSVPEIRKYFRVAHFHKLLTVCDLRLRKKCVSYKIFRYYCLRSTTHNIQQHTNDIINVFLE